MEPFDQTQLLTNLPLDLDLPVNKLNNSDDGEVGEELLSEKVSSEQTHIGQQSTVGEDEPKSNFHDDKPDSETVKLQLDDHESQQDFKDNVILQEFESTKADTNNCTNKEDSEEQLNVSGSLNSEEFPAKPLEECHQKTDVYKLDDLEENGQNMDDIKNEISEKPNCSIENEYSESDMADTNECSQVITKEENQNTAVADNENIVINTTLEADKCNNFTTEHELTKSFITARRKSNGDERREEDVDLQTKQRKIQRKNRKRIASADETLSLTNLFRSENKDESVPRTLSDKSVIPLLNDKNFNNSELDNEDSSSSFKSASTKRSITSTSSSQQLVIDHSMDDTENAKLAPLKLSIKRKAVNKAVKPKTNNIQMVETEKHGNQNNSNQNILLENCVSRLNIPSAMSEESLNPPKENGFKHNRHNSDSLCNERQITSEIMAKRNVLKNRYYKCEHCMTFHEEWNFFNHVRDHHNRFICFHCLRLFTTAERLSLHMENKHDLEQNHFNTVKAWNVADAEGGRNLTCCMCQHVFQVNESFAEHNCSDFLHPCDVCKQRGKHANHCKYNNARNFSKTRIKKKFFTSLEAQLPPDKSKTPELIDQEISCNVFNDVQNNADAVQQQRLITNTDINTSDGETYEPQNTLPENIENEVTAAVEEPPIPKLVIPKIMLRVPKQFQKSVNDELSFTDSEEFDEDEHDEHDDHNSSTQSVEDPTNIAEQSLPLFEGDTNSATETATEASVMNERSAQTGYENTVPQENSEESLGNTNSNLSRILDEIANTDMNTLKAEDIAADKQDITKQSNDRKNSETMVNQVWSPTPPASPQPRSLTPRRLISQSDFETSCNKDTKDSSIETENEKDDTVTDESIEKIENPIGNDSNFSVKGETEELNSEKNELTVMDLDVSKSEKNESMLVKNVDITDQSTPNQQSLNETTQSDTLEIASEDTVSVELQLDRPLDKFEIVEFIRLCLKTVYPLCLYCNHARRIAVSAKSLVMHLIAQHRFTATVDSITAEELKSETIVSKLKSTLTDLENEYLNLSSYCTMETTDATKEFNERIYECFQCRYVTSTHKELYMHNRRLHMKTAILCFMCRLNFFSFSEILCHICPGEATKSSIFDVKYRCCFCETTNLPSAFRLMVHLRKKHSACDVCLEDCVDQSKLSSHVWKHKLHHLCYRCGIAYRNKQDITKHLYWKHGTESIKCKRCLQKRWRHVYHFCVPPTSFVCDECNLCFSKAMYLEVHKRLHAGDLRYACTEEECKDVFVSRRLLLKHASTQHETNATDMPTPKTELDAETKTTPTTVDATLKTENNDQEIDVENVENVNKLSADKTDPTPIAEKCEENSQTNKEVYRKKRKRNKNSKESLEDLNLIAPNLSESDSFDDSDTDSKTNNENTSLNLPKVVLSPLSESDGQVSPKSNHGNTELEEKIPDIWKNLLKDNNYINSSYQDDTLISSNISSPKSEYPMPKMFHVSVSDHDYCKMFRPQTKNESEDQESTTKTPRKNGKSRRNSDNLSSDCSSESSSSSDSSSSCSCGSNCSCSSSDSDSSSSSSSSNNSNLSSTPKTGGSKRQRKKSMRKKSVSPLKPLQTSPVDVNEVNEEVDKNNSTEESKSPPLNESDLETAESETDEEFYDEHPQKLANELLAQKRAILLAQTRMSPSHNFDIVENSRPSTPSLPEDLSLFGEKRTKSKKKKRDRKSTTKANQKSNATLDTSVEYASIQDLQFSMPHPQTNQNQIVGDMNSTLPAAAQQTLYSTGAYSRELTNQFLPTQPLAPIANASMKHRSEGSSCSDLDATLKRSKRTRRPNRFYGYSSDDENMSTVLAPPLMVGMQLIKPQPPPQLTWAKEDLPAPTKNNSNHKHKGRASKTSHNASAEANVPNGGFCRRKKKRTSNNEEKTHYKRRRKERQTDFEDTTSLPPIPTLKIRSSQLIAAKSNSSDESAETTSEDDVDDTVFEDPKSMQIMSATDKTNEIETQQMNVEVPKTSLPMRPVPVPEATVFKQKIPPALLPNPDFATLQYFKANNIRYPIRPPAGARLAREGEAVYCYCRCPYDEVSEMIACDGENCLIEWFHFECVGIMLAPQGKWFCAECRPKYSEELYPTTKT